MADTQLPACAIECQDRFLKEVPICTYDELFDSPLKRCVQANCATLEDVLQWQTQYAASCNLPARDQSVMEVVLAYALFGIASLSVIGRLLSRSRRMNGPGFWWDDGLVIVLWILSIELVVCLVFLRNNWAGRDAIDFVGREQIENVAMWVYICEPFYIIETYGTKLVWVMLYLRMWDANTLFRKLSWATAFLLIMGLIGFTIGAIATSWPYHYYIGQSAVVRSHHGPIELIPAVLTIGVLNVALDFWILLLPIPKLLALKGVSRQCKIGICLVFLFGFIVTACSIVRFTSIMPLRHSTNATWDFGHFGTWSEVEVHLSMLSCNLPALAGFVHRLAWRYRRSSDNNAEGDSSQTSQQAEKAPSDTQSSGATDVLSSADGTLYEDTHGRVLQRGKDEQALD